MRIGILSDIHSNLIAFKACFEYMEAASCDEYMFLGDYISDTPYTRETMDYLYDFSSKNKLSVIQTRSTCPASVVTKWKEIKSANPPQMCYN